MYTHIHTKTDIHIDNSDPKLYIIHHKSWFMRNAPALDGYTTSLRNRGRKAARGNMHR